MVKKMMADKDDGSKVISCFCPSLKLIDFDRKDERHEIELQNSMTAIPLFKRNRPYGPL